MTTITTARRRVGFAITLALAVSGGAPAMAGEVVWKTAIWGASRPATQGVEWFMKEAAAKTGGQLSFQPSFDQVKPTEGVNLVKSGAYEAAYFCVAYVREQMPLVSVMELPMFGPESISALGRVELALADHPAIQEEQRKLNVKMLMPVPLPQVQIMSMRPIAKLEDFRGAKVRIAPEAGKSLEEFGATIRMLSGPESAAALKSGALDVAAFPYTTGFAAFKIHETAKYVTDKISLGTQLCYLGVSHKAWEALPAPTQKVLLGLRQPAVSQYEEIYAREDARHIVGFKQRGLEYVTFSSADRARLLAKTIKVWQAWVDEREKQGLKGREVFEFTQAKIREFTRK